MNRLLGYLVTFVMLIFVFDVVLRIAGCGPQPQVVEFDADRGWANRKEVTVHRKGRGGEFSVDYALNSYGMRGPEIGAEKGNTKRILFVGDSFTLGYTVTDAEGFVRVLEKDLRANGQAVEALNGGTEGYSTDQELLFFEKVGKAFKPDYVVFAPYLNDVYQNSQATYTIRKKPLFAAKGDDLVATNLPLPDPGPTPFWVKHSAVGTLIDNVMNPRRPALTTVGGRTVVLEDCPLLVDAPSAIDEAWTITGALVKKLGREIVAAGAKPIALLVPNKWEIHPDAPLPPTLPGISRSELDPAKATNRFGELCKAAGFIVVDPREALRAEAAKGTKLYFDIDWHWNRDGYRVAAGTLLQRFSQPDLLGPGTGAVKGETVDHAESGGIPTWAIVVGILWLILGTFYSRSYKRENPVLAYVKVAALIAFVGGVFYGVGKLAGSLPHAVGVWVTPAVLIGLLIFILVKIGKRISVINELYGTFLRRGHWYMLPMIVVMLSIGMLLVVAASSPFVAPFIYTLF